MKTARIFVLPVACLLFASNVFAQSSHTPEPRVTNVMERYVVPDGFPRPIPHTTTMYAAGLDFSITRDTDWQDLSNGLQHTFFLSVKNLTSDPLPITIIRTQQLPAGWISSICDPGTCHQASDSSVPWTIGPDSSANFSLNLTPALDDESDSGTIWLRVGVAGGSVFDTVLPFYANYLPSNPPLIFQWSDTVRERTFSGPGIWTLSDFLTNLAGRAINYSLSFQDSVPAGWSLKLCDTRDPSIPTDTCASGNILVTNFSDVTDGGTTYQQRLKFTLDAPTVALEDSAVIYLSVHPQTSNPADSGNYRFVMIVQPSSEVASTNADRAGVAITNAWPNPLIGTGALHLEILTDQAGPATALIYDVTGTQKGMLDLGMLHEGTNELQTTAPSLPSGEYIIRVNQGSSASEVLRINYVK